MKNRTQLLLVTALIALINLPLLFGQVSTPLIFTPQGVLAGDWWQLITFPFVHVSLYHLLLDAAAFLFLFHELRHQPGRRLLYICAAALGSLLLCLLTAPLDTGLCGLSGIAHGLLAIYALDTIKQPDSLTRKAGWITLFIVTTKSLLELLTGHPLLNLLHLGDVGSPVPACHAGGILGALTIRLLLSRTPKYTCIQHRFRPS